MSPLATRPHLSGDPALRSLLGTASPGLRATPASAWHVGGSGSVCRAPRVLNQGLRNLATEGWVVSGTFWCQASGVPEKAECRALAGARCAPFTLRRRPRPLWTRQTFRHEDCLLRPPAQTEPDESPRNGHPAPSYFRRLSSITEKTRSLDPITTAGTSSEQTLRWPGHWTGTDSTQTHVQILVPLHPTPVAVASVS